MPDKIARRIGALMGAAVGDALGLTFEFQSAHTIPPGRFAIVGGGPFDFGAGEASDDTDLLHAVLSAYGSRNMFDRHRAVIAMVAWLDRDPPDVGGQTRAALSAWRSGRAPRDNEAAQGNGGLMRAAAHALSCDSSRIAAAFAAEDTLLTHPSDSAAACSAFHAAVLWWLIDGASTDDAMEMAARDASSFLPYDEPEPSLSGHCMHSLRLALWAVRSATDFESGLDSVIRTGGDTDTNAAIAGALLGGKFGLSAIPNDWLDGLDIDNRARLDAEATRLLL